MKIADLDSQSSEDDIGRLSQHEEERSDDWLDPTEQEVRMQHELNDNLNEPASVGDAVSMAEPANKGGFLTAAEILSGKVPKSIVQWDNYQYYEGDRVKSRKTNALGTVTNAPPAPLCRKKYTVSWDNGTTNTTSALYLYPVEIADV